MVIHQAVVMYIYFVDMASFAEYLQELLFIFIVPVDIGARYTSVNDVMKSIQVQSGFACHSLLLVVEKGEAYFCLGSG